jgi:hypothetical protein
MGGPVGERAGAALERALLRVPKQALRQLSKLARYLGAIGGQSKDEYKRERIRSTQWYG